MDIELGYQTICGMKIELYLKSHVHVYKTTLEFHIHVYRTKISQVSNYMYIHGLMVVFEMGAFTLQELHHEKTSFLPMRKEGQISFAVIARLHSRSAPLFSLHG